MSPLFAAGTLLMLLGVALGAFGAHALKAVLDAAALASWQTAVDYQMWHGLGLLAVALADARAPGLRAAGWTMVAGTLLFSGSLYLLALSGVRALGMVTPIGGTLLLAAWGLAARAALKRS